MASLADPLASLNEVERHILKLALIALCMEHEGTTSTPLFRANMRGLARKLGLLDGLLDMATREAHND